MTTPETTDDDLTRTHLANERTFLSWMRSAISLIALGIGIAAFLDRPTNYIREALAAATILAGVAVLIVGFHRYRVMRAQIERNAQYHPFTRAIAVATVIVTIVATAVSAVIILHR